MAKSENEGFLANLFLWVGVIAGGAAGAESGEFGAVLVCAVVFGAIGFWVGRVADAVLAWLIFVGVTVVLFLINSAIRRFVWELLSAAFGGA
jgi:hypothetical protein